jgi:hypothetical protein
VLRRLRHARSLREADLFGTIQGTFQHYSRNIKHKSGNIRHNSGNFHSTQRRDELLRLLRHAHSFGEAGLSGTIQRTFGIIQGTFIISQGTFGIIQGLFRIIQKTARISQPPSGMSQPP